MMNSFNHLKFPNEGNGSNMWDLITELFPIYRTLIGSGFLESLKVINKYLPLDISEFPTGMEVLDWTIPKGFEVREAWVDNPDGERIIDFAKHPYAVWTYSQPFYGVIDYEDLLPHLTSIPEMPDAIPLRQSYYRENWGLSCTDRQRQSLNPGKYRVHIDCEHTNDFLRIGEHFLKGEVEEEILISSYLCHPLGANDNLSGVVVAVELFRMLAELPKRHYSYRLVLWPETIGTMTYLASYPDRLAKTIGGYQPAMCGDGSPLGIDHTKVGNSLFDRAVHHATKILGIDILSRPFNIYAGSDVPHLNSIGIDLPIAFLTRGGSRHGGYPEYHTSFDDLNLVKSESLLETLKVLWVALLIVERAKTYKATYRASPFMFRHGIFPYQHGAGVGGRANEIGDAYFAIIPMIDGTRDLLEIADWADLPIFAFDECVADFLKAGLMTDAVP